MPWCGVSSPGLHHVLHASHVLIQSDPGLSELMTAAHHSWAPPKGEKRQGQGQGGGWGRGRGKRRGKGDRGVGQGRGRGREKRQKQDTEDLEGQSGMEGEKGVSGGEGEEGLGVEGVGQPATPGQAMHFGSLQGMAAMRLPAEMLSDARLVSECRTLFIMCNASLH